MVFAGCATYKSPVNIATKYQQIIHGTCSGYETFYFKIRWYKVFLKEQVHLCYSFLHLTTFCIMKYMS